MMVNDWGNGIVFNTITGKIELPHPDVGFHMEKFFSWFPDNKRVLIQANMGSLWLADSLSGKYIILAVPGYGSVDGAAASPDGKSIIYSLSGGISEPSIWKVNADGRNAQLLFELAGRVSFFSWSPDGKQIVFLGDGWMVMDADGSNLRQLGYLGTPACLQPPIWSPDSRWLALVVSNSPESDCRDWSQEAFRDINILIIDPETGESRPILPDGNTGNLDPAWSPDGSQIAFVSIRSGTTEIWVVDVYGNNLRQLTDASRFVRFPFWVRP